MFHKDWFVVLYSSLFSSMIFRLLCLLPSAALFSLTIWPLGPPPPRSSLRGRPHKELGFNWKAGLSTGIFLSIRANVRPPSSHWIPTKLTSSPTSDLSWGHLRTHSFLFQTCIFTEGQILSISQGLMLYLCFLKALYSLLYKAFLRPLLTYASPYGFLFSVTNITYRFFGP